MTHNKSTINALILIGLFVFGSSKNTKAMEQSPDEQFHIKHYYPLYQEIQDNCFSNRMFHTILLFISEELYHKYNINELTFEDNFHITRYQRKFYNFLLESRNCHTYDFNPNDYEVISRDLSIFNTFLSNPSDTIEDIDDELKSKLSYLIVRYYVCALSNKHYFINKIHNPSSNSFDLCLHHNFKLFFKQNTKKHNQDYTNKIFEIALMFISEELYHTYHINELTIKQNRIRTVKDNFNNFLRRMSHNKYYTFHTHDYDQITSNPSLLHNFLLDPKNIPEDIHNKLKYKLTYLIVWYYAYELKYMNYFMDRKPEWYESFEPCLNYQFRAFFDSFE